MKRLILGSGSRHRQALLSRLGLPFETIVPAIPEDRLDNEAPEAMATRLARAKARAVADLDALIIGSDQVAANAAGILRKPGNVQRAVEQLLECQGREVHFFTAVTLYDQTSQTSRDHLDHTIVRFAKRRREEIENYVRIEQPLDCAGGFKVEGLGISLFDSVVSEDPTALVGLPLIALSRLLCQAGLDPLSEHAGARGPETA